MAIIGLGAMQNIPGSDVVRGRELTLGGFGGGGGGVPRDLLERGAAIRQMGQLGGPGAGGGLFDPFGQTGVGNAPTSTQPRGLPTSPVPTTPAQNLPFPIAPIFPQLPSVPLMSNLPMNGGMVDFNALAGMLAGPIPNMSGIFPGASPSASPMGLVDPSMWGGV